MVADTVSQQLLAVWLATRSLDLVANSNRIVGASKNFCVTCAFVVHNTTINDRPYFNSRRAGSGKQGQIAEGIAALRERLSAPGVTVVGACAKKNPFVLPESTQPGNCRKATATRASRPGS